MIKFIFVSILIIFFIRLVAPALFRWLLGMFIKKQMRKGAFFNPNMHQGQPQRPQQNYSANGKPEGKVKIDYMPEQPDKRNFDGGEYVDYEEVK